MRELYSYTDSQGDVTTVNTFDGGLLINASSGGVFVPSAEVPNLINALCLVGEVMAAKSQAVDLAALDEIPAFGDTSANQLKALDEGAERAATLVYMLGPDASADEITAAVEGAFRLGVLAARRVVKGGDRG